MAKWQITHIEGDRYKLSNISGDDYTNVVISNDDERFLDVYFEHNGIDLDDGDSVPFMASAAMNNEADYVTVNWTDPAGAQKSKKVFI